jgi:hypothetical protein
MSQYRTKGTDVGTCRQFACMLFWAFSLAAVSSNAQVFWDIDFDSSTDLLFDTYHTIFHLPDSEAVVTYGTIDTGDASHHNALQFTVDSSGNAYPWSANWTGMLVIKTIATYDPGHTFMAFDLLVYEQRPFNVQITYGGSGFNVRQLSAYVNPSVTGSFERFMVPLTAFQTNITIGEAGTGPSAFIFGIQGDPANPDTTWPSCATNMFLLDNIRYVISPPLSIATSNNAVILSWPTISPGFDLQQTTDLSNWTSVTTAPIATNGVSQVVASPAGPQRFFRLIGPFSN